VSTFIYAGRSFTREALDAVWDFTDRTRTPPDWWLCLAEGESGLNEEADHDGDLGGGYFGIYTPVHGGTPADWKGVEGVTRSMERMWFADGRWAANFARFGGWNGWLGRATLPHDSTLPPVIYQGRAEPVDPAVPYRGRAAYLYHAWPRYQGSRRPTWARCLEVEAFASALAVAFAEDRAARRAHPPPAPVVCHERELLDALTVHQNAYGEESQAFGQAAARMAQRAADIAALIDQHRH
jgi:hypothetical protein